MGKIPISVAFMSRWMIGAYLWFYLENRREVKFMEQRVVMSNSFSE